MGIWHYSCFFNNVVNYRRLNAEKHYASGERTEYGEMALKNDHRGFTLVELVITLAVAMILIAAFPVARGALPEIRVNSFARGLAQELREARAMSLVHGTDVIVTFDLSNSIISIYSDNDLDGIELADLVRSKKMSDYGTSVQIHAVTTTGVDGEAISSPIKFGETYNPIAVTFRPNGSASNIGVIYLAPITSSNIELGRAIEVLSTGKINTWKYNINGSPGPWERWL